MFVVVFCGVMRCRLQQQTEFDCFVKSFTYLAARLPRSEFLEPFLDEAVVTPVKNMMKEVQMMKKMKDMQLSEVLPDFDENVFMAGIQQATGKPIKAALPADDTPLSVAEPDMYPCLLAMCGSAFVGFQVSFIFIIFIVVVIDNNYFKDFGTL